MRSILVLTTFIFCLFSSFGQNDFYQSDYLRYTNWVYVDNIKTVECYRSGWQGTFPQINLNSGESITLEFDDLDLEQKDYYYTFIHCDSDWSPSDLDLFDYLEGNTDPYIFDVNFSRRSLNRYIHYSVNFPNNEVKLTKSGNYLVKIYENGEPDHPVITWRFIISENGVGLKTNIKQATLAEYRYTHQEVDFSIVETSTPITNAYQDLKVVLMQNQRWDNIIADLKPQFVKGSEFTYNYDRENVFPGFNEFRFFDTRSINFKPEGTDKIILNNDTNTIILTPVTTRAHLNYKVLPDINGHFFIHTDDRGDVGSIDADYNWVYFTLVEDEPPLNGDYYIFGALTNWQILPEFKMNYIIDKKIYLNKVLLKQGYYNYAYIYVPFGESKGDLSRVEGTHSETTNEYQIIVYYRTSVDRYDRVLKVETINYPLE